MKNEHAVNLGRLGGLKKSKRKAEAAKANAKKPRKGLNAEVERLKDRVNAMRPSMLGAAALIRECIGDAPVADSLEHYAGDCER